MSYNYYQKVGGNEDWKPIPTDDLGELKDVMFVTILSVETPITEEIEASREELNKMKYNGPLYFDLDDANSPVSTSKHLVSLMKKLMEDQLDIGCVKLYATGGKGFHVIIPQGCFMDKVPAKGIQYLPAIYKEIAFQYSVPSMDFRVYTARRGRMFRMPNVQRENKRYKVPVTWAEVQELAALDPEAGAIRYAEICAAPRAELLVQVPKRAFGLQAKYDAAERKVSESSKKVAKQKPVDLPDDLPSFDAMLRGEGILSGKGFHEIALQVAITAHARSMTEDELIEAAQGLIENHESDGHRYNSADKRRYELRRMYEYTEDNPCYQYSAGAIRSLLSHQAADLRGMAVDREEVEAEIEAAENLEEGETLPDKPDGPEVILTKDGTFITNNGNTHRLTNLTFRDVGMVRSSDNGEVAHVSFSVYENGAKLGERHIPIIHLNDKSALVGMCLAFGNGYHGNEPQTMYLAEKFLKMAERSNNVAYATEREGLDYLALPFHKNPEAAKGFTAWSDVTGIMLQKSMRECEDVRIKFVPRVAYGTQYGSDLSQAPRMKEVLDEPEQREKLHTLVHSLLHSQEPAYFGKLIGWMVACHYRMLFHKAYDKFPLLHVNGAAGAGKTEGVKLVSHLHYYNAEPKMSGPSSTIFSLRQAAAGSASIPLVLDEYKPTEMDPRKYEDLKLMLREAYNCKDVEKGGGNAQSKDFNAISRTKVAAPICFIAEATETEPAVMERVVLLTLVKPTTLRNQQYLMNFMKAQEHASMLGVIGAFIVRNILANESLESFKAEFQEIYDATKKEMMIQPGEEDTLKPDEFRRKSAAKERTVFNYSVLRFGLKKFAKVLYVAFGDEFKEITDKMYNEATSSVEDVQSQTTPEWLKVLNRFTDMAGHDPYVSFHLKAKKDYAHYQNEQGDEVVEFNLRLAFSKYRQFCHSTGEKPLFATDSAFLHGISNAPATLEKNCMTGKIRCSGGSFIFSLDELRALGYREISNGKD